MAKTPVWQRKAGQNPSGGLNEAGRRSLRAEGHDIKRPQPEGGARKKSFCARMEGAKKKLTSSETANDPDSRINKSLRAWNCADGGAVDPYKSVQDAANTDSRAPYGVVDMGNKIIIGSPHGDQIPLSDELRTRIQDVANKSGAWYEGAGGDIEQNKKLIPSYKGSWDDQIARNVEGYPSEYLAPMFSNVEVNKPHELYVDPNRSIFESILANQDKAKYFKDRRFNKSSLQDFLSQGSEKDADFVKMSQLPATKENLRKFFSTGERLMWPDNWQEYPHKLGQLAKRFEESRNKYLLNAPPGVYVTGAGHIPELRGMSKDLKVIGGERASEADGGAVDPYDSVQQAAKGGQIWDKPRPKKLGNPEPLSSKEKASAKAAAKAAGRPYPNLIDNMRAARAEGGVTYPLSDRDEWTAAKHYDEHGGRMTHMSPDAFLDRARPLHIDDATQRSIDAYKGQIASGHHMNPLQLLANGLEDGRHRATAAKELGIRSVPVIDFRADGGEVDPYDAVQNAANTDSLPSNFSAEDIQRASRGATPAVPTLSVTENAVPSTPFADSLRSAYNAAIPPTARLLAEGAMGIHTPITEADFSQSDIQNMKDRLAEQQQFNAGREGNLKTIQYTMTPEGYRHYQAITEQPIGDINDYNRFMQHNAEALQSFQKTRGQTSVPYGTTFGKEDQPNQPLSVYSNEQGGIANAINRSYNDPGYRTGMTLGRFNVYDTPQGRIAVDNYDFRGQKQSLSDIANYFQTKPGVTALRAAIPTLLPNIERPVVVNLDKPGNYTYTGKPILTPGSHLNPEQTATPRRDDIADYKTKTPGFWQFNKSAQESRTPNVTAPLPPRRPAGFADGGEVEGDVQFADDDPYAKVQEAAKLPMMAQNDFAMRMPQPDVRYDTGPQPGEAELKAYEPTVREQIAQKLMGDERPSGERQQFVHGLMGTTGIGQQGMGVADFIPVGGQALQAQESYQHRDPKGFLLATVPVPGANIEGKIAQGAAAAVERAMAGQAAQQMTKSQSQAAMKQAWEAGQGNADKYRNWQHQWNVEHGPQYAVQQAVQASPPPMGHNMPPEPVVPADYTRVVNPVGFYSLGHEVAMTQLPDTVRTWQEMQSLLKQGGVKDEEMKWAGLLGYDPKQKVSREEIAQAFERNFPQVEAAWKRKDEDWQNAPVVNQMRSNREIAERDLTQANGEFLDSAFGRDIRGNPNRLPVNVQGYPDPISLVDLRNILMSNPNFDVGLLDEHMRVPALNWREALQRYNQADTQYLNSVRDSYAAAGPSVGPPKWEKYTHPGGTNYSESILRLPYNNPQEIRSIHPDIEAKYSDEHAALKEKMFNLKEAYAAQRKQDNEQFSIAQEQFKQRFYDKVVNEALADGADPEFAMRFAKKILNNSTYNEMGRYLGEQPLRDLDFMSPRSEQLNDELYKTREEIGAFTNKMLEETRALAGHPAYTQQHFSHETHLGNIDNPLLHQRWKERVGPQGERILSNEEFQSDLGQEGADKGFKDPAAQRKRADLERQLKTLETEWGAEKNKLDQQFNDEIAPIMQQKRAEIKQVTDAYNQTRQLRSEFDAYNDQLAAIDDKYAPLLQPYKDKRNAAGLELTAKYKPISKSLNDQMNALPKQGDIPLFPHVGTTDQWIELGAKHALQHALESGHDKIFIMGGQEQARRWQSGMRQAVDNIRWKGEAKPWKGFGTDEEQKAATDRYNRARQVFHDISIYDPEYDAVANEYQNASDALRDIVPGWGRASYEEIPQSEGFRTVYANPASGGRETKFVVDKEGNIIDSSMSDAKGKKLKDAVGGDLAKRIMGEESGNIPMDKYVMGAEGYTHHYERKIPSIYKDIIKKYLKVEPKVEAGKLLERGEPTKIGPMAQRALSEVHADIPPWGRVEPQGNDAYRVVFPDGSFRGGYGREAAEQIVERARNRAESQGVTHQSQPPIEFPAVEGPHGTYIHITPEMREAYQRIKKQRGSVFPGYAKGGEVVNKSDPYDNIRLKAKNFPRARRVSH